MMTNPCVRAMEGGGCDEFGGDDESKKKIYIFLKLTYFMRNI